MTHLKRISVFLLHLGVTVLTQVCLLRLLLGESEPSAGAALLRLLPAVGACLLDLVVSCLLLRDGTLDRRLSMALHFWDIVLCCPLLVLGFFGMLSEGTGVLFGTCVLLLDLLLVVERSTAFVLLDPTRKK